MKRAILLFCVSAASFVLFAQTDPEDPKNKKANKKQGIIPGIKNKAKDKIHKGKLEKSKKNGKCVSSRDTLYSSGKPYAIAAEISHNLVGAAIVYSFKAFKQKEEAFKVTLESVSSGSNAVYYWVWTRGDLRFETEHKESPLELVCYYYLFSDSTLYVKNFNSLKTSKAKAISGYNGAPAPKPKEDNEANRNRNDNITLSGRDIRQSSVLIGHIEATTSTHGTTIITAYTIYNKGGNIVATAKNHGVTDHEWEIITATDKKVHNVTSSLLHDQEDVVKHLVDLLYL